MISWFYGTTQSVHIVHYDTLWKIQNYMYSTLWKLQKFILTKKFRQINFLVISLVIMLFSRNFWQKWVRVNFRNFHTTLWKLRNFTATDFPQNFHQIKVLLRNWFDGKKFAWQWISRFSTLCSVHNVEKRKIHCHEHFFYRQINLE